MNLDLSPKEIEFIFDELDSNAINFRLESGYFSIQTCVYLEEEEELNEPLFELNDQGDSQSGGLECIVFSERGIFLEFRIDDKFLRKYRSITIHLNNSADVKIVDFFVNHLFLATHVQYEKGFPQSIMVSQTNVRDLL